MSNMSTKDKMIEILISTFNEIEKNVPQSNNKAEKMTNPKHLELVERYAKVLSQHYVAKMARLCTNMLALDVSNEEQTKHLFGKFENKMQEVANGFPKDMDTTMKSVKKYFGQNYSNDCLVNVTAEAFANDLTIEKQIFLDWAENLKMEDDFITTKVDEKVSA